jgi:hypothetical protein
MDVAAAAGSFTFVPDTAGTYVFKCTVGGWGDRGIGRRVLFLPASAPCRLAAGARRAPCAAPELALLLLLLLPPQVGDHCSKGGMKVKVTVTC